MMQLRVSSKKQAKIKLALQGCAGSGKTYSALLLAYGLCNDWSKIAVIDSENGSADLYAHLGAYNVLSLQDNFTPETYMEAIGICEAAGMEVIIIDSISNVGTTCWSIMRDYREIALSIGKRSLQESMLLCRRFFKVRSTSSAL